MGVIWEREGEGQRRGADGAESHTENGKNGTCRVIRVVEIVGVLPRSIHFEPGETRLYGREGGVLD
jgi:hypothetical protein